MSGGGAVESRADTPPIAATAACARVPAEAPSAQPEKPPTEPQRRPARRTGAILEPELVRVAAGYFWMGSDDSDVDADNNQKPRHKVYLNKQWIGRYPVTNEEYRCFLLDNSDHSKSDGCQGFEFPSGKARHPAAGVDWQDAVDYCSWQAQITGQPYCLPTEAQWEKAARGVDGRIYPWGNAAPDASHCNFNNNVKDTTEVGKYSPQGDSPYGSADMAGNVWQWVTDWYQESYYRRSPTHNPTGPDSDYGRVLRGGSFSNSRRDARCAFRGTGDPHDWYENNGFRVGVFSPIFVSDL